MISKLTIQTRMIFLTTFHTHQKNQHYTWSSVLQVEVLILKLGAVDALAASAIVVGEVTTLAHEVWDDAVEDGVFVAISLLTSTQCTEVFWTRYTSV